MQEPRDRRGGRRRFGLPHAAAGALALEAVLIAALLLYWPRPVPPKPKPVTVLLSFPTLPKPKPKPAPPKPKPAPPKPPPPKPKPPPPKPKPPPPKPVPKPNPKPKRVRHRVVRHRVVHRVKRPPPVPIAAVAPRADTLPAPAPPPLPPPPPAPPPPPSVDPSGRANFEDAVRAAVQAAVRYPFAARLAHLSGRARVAFRYRDGAVSRVVLVVSSGSDLLDAAALQAVRAANYPPPPPRLAGHVFDFALWVRFNLTDSSD